MKEGLVGRLGAHIRFKAVRIVANQLASLADRGDRGACLNLSVENASLSRVNPANSRPRRTQYAVRNSLKPSVVVVRFNSGLGAISDGPGRASGESIHEESQKMMHCAGYFPRLSGRVSRWSSCVNEPKNFFSQRQGRAPCDVCTRWVKIPGNLTDLRSWLEAAVFSAVLGAGCSKDSLSNLAARLAAAGCFAGAAAGCPRPGRVFRVLDEYRNGIGKTGTAGRRLCQRLPHRLVPDVLAVVHPVEVDHLHGAVRA